MGCTGDEDGHGGIIGATVDSVSAGALVCRSLKGAQPSSNPSFTPVGRIVSIIGRPEGGHTVL